MSSMQYEVFDALKSVGIDNEKARKAAEALSNEHNESRFNIIERRMLRLELMVSGVLVLLVPMFLKIFELV